MERIIDLNKLRQTLIILEEAVIFSLMQRTAYRINPPVYLKNKRVADNSDSLLDFILLGTERIHARAGRYKNPDEFPFFNNLPEPILEPTPERVVPELKLQKEKMNINPQIKEMYITEIIPRICIEGLDFEFGSSAVLDVSALFALSKRIHFGIFVAESKFLTDREEYTKYIIKKDHKRLRQMLTDLKMENKVYQRVVKKARFYGRDELRDSSEKNFIDPGVIGNLYFNRIIPLTKDVELMYLLDRLD
jgi:chorismate mutase